jgi:hypothetical protein
MSFNAQRLKYMAKAARDNGWVQLSPGDVAILEWAVGVAEKRAREIEEMATEGLVVPTVEVGKKFRAKYHQPDNINVKKGGVVQIIGHDINSGFVCQVVEDPYDASSPIGGYRFEATNVTDWEEVKEES